MVVVDRREAAIEPGAVLVRDRALFVRIETLAVWFPLDQTFDRSDLAISITPCERLPIEGRRLRAERRETVHAHRTANAQPSWPRLAGHAVIAPAVQSSLQTAWLAGGHMTASGDVATYLDVMGAVLSTRVDVARGRRPHVRVAASRMDPDGRALGGVVPATRWMVDEIGAAETPSVWRAAFGRGATITNAALNRAFEFDRIPVRGEAPKGYDYELCRNGLLIDAARDEGDGRYEFPDTPLLLGANDLEVVMYGPQGQVRRQKQTVVIGPGALQRGGMDYSVSLVAPDVRNDAKSEESFLQWGYFPEILQRTEYVEGYVIAPLAERMMAADPKLKSEFEQKLASDPRFAADGEARLEWFYARTPFYDDRHLIYPIGLDY
jgi:hypothetical protein